MYKLTVCEELCTCENCKESCEWAGRSEDFEVVNKRGDVEFYDGKEYLETPIPNNDTSCV